jgi:aminocarboxymuconate-semialdehyde decarboxylase
MPVIDVHTHFFPRSWPDLDARYGGKNWPSIRHTEPGKAVVLLGDRVFRDIDAGCWDPEVRLQHMDRDGVDYQVVSATPVLFAYDRDPEDALDCARIFNDLALELTSRGKGRLLPLCQVPLQDVDKACEELTRSMRAGHLGVEIGNHVGAKNLDDEGILAFLQHAAAEDAAVFVHPWDMMASDRTEKYMMGWTVGMPAETQLSIASLVLSGGFDRLPENLRIGFAHGGGSFAFLLGRLENAWMRQSKARGAAEHPPSHYLDRFLVDSAVFDERALAFLVEVLGEDRIALGSDYPFPQKSPFADRPNENPGVERGFLRGTFKACSSTEPKPAPVGSTTKTRSRASATPFTSPPGSISAETLSGSCRRPRARGSRRSSTPGPGSEWKAISREPIPGCPTTGFSASPWPGWWARFPRKWW